LVPVGRAVGSSGHARNLSQAFVLCKAEAPGAALRRGVLHLAWSQRWGNPHLRHVTRGEVSSVNFEAPSQTRSHAV
jgi:hypothetical protein